MTTATKTLVVANWNPTKVQTETAEAFARNMGVTMTVLHKLGADAVKEFEKLSTENKVAHFKKLPMNSLYNFRNMNTPFAPGMEDGRKRSGEQCQKQLRF